MIFLLKEKKEDKTEEKIDETIICISCPLGCRINVEGTRDEIEKIVNYGCPAGKKYAREEFKNPTRVLPTTVRVRNGEFPLVPVKTAKAIPKKLLIPAMKVIAQQLVEAPVDIGQTIIEDLLDTGISVITTREISRKKE